MAISPMNEKIILNFGWKGSGSWHGGSSRGGLDVRVVDLVFKNAKTAISASIPQNISTSTVQKLPFTCKKYHEFELEFNGLKSKPLLKETHPDSLKVTLEQIRDLTIKAGIFEESPRKGPAVMDRSGHITHERRLIRSDREIKLDLPEELEIGQIYTLVVTSDDLSLSASFQKEANANGKMENKHPRQEEIQKRLGKMGEALVTEGIKNLDLASNGGVGVFDSSSTSADVFAHGMQGVIRSGQQVLPEIRVPHTRPSESSSDLNGLTAEQLQSRFEATFIKDKEFESQRMHAAFAGNIEEMNTILELEHANSQLLISLADALEKKGIQAQIPQSESFRSAANLSQQAHAKALEETCKVQ